MPIMSALGCIADMPRDAPHYRTRSIDGAPALSGCGDLSNGGGLFAGPKCSAYK